MMDSHIIYYNFKISSKITRQRKTQESLHYAKKKNTNTGKHTDIGIDGQRFLYELT